MNRKQDVNALAGRQPEGGAFCGAATCVVRDPNEPEDARTTSCAVWSARCPVMWQMDDRGVLHVFACCAATFLYWLTKWNG
uniref:hypothetical protein n=1 Tax=Burkholderia anthina TaxID=179879 RepID=UPI00158B5C88|nr:hypothetical protein [Burkholderia anthina]